MKYTDKAFVLSLDKKLEFFQLSEQYFVRYIESEQDMVILPDM